MSTQETRSDETPTPIAAAPQAGAPPRTAPAPRAADRDRPPLPRPVRVLLGVLGPLLLLGGWQAYVRIGNVDEILLPAPTTVLHTLVDDRALLWEAFLRTAQEILFGLAIALVVGAGLAVAMHLSRVVRATLGPLVVGSQAIPLPVLAPVLVFWLGFGLQPKLAIVAIICFFPVTIATLDALDRTDPDLDRLLRTMGASRWQRMRWVELPAALPAAISGAKVSVAIGGIAAIFAEYAGYEQGRGGLGGVIQTAQLDTARAFAAVAILAAFAIVTTGALAGLGRLLAPWAHRRPDGR
jgi:ABC-type nitrate/sulfonate/bicarbonate transport system permease component